MRTIYINGRFLCRQMTGVDRFAYEILLAADRLLATSEFQHVRLVVLVPSKPLNAQFTNIRIESLPWGRGHVWEQFALPLRTLGRPLLNLCNTGPVLKWRQFTTIHDATTVRVPEAFSRSFRLFYRVLMPALGGVSRKIFSVSDFAKRDIVSAFGIRPEKVLVLGEGGDHIHRHVSDAAILQKHSLNDQPYFLAVSSNAPHKNFKLLAEAIALGDLSDCKVAIAGGSNQRVFGKAQVASNADVVWLGYVTDAELKALYENATAFIFPSLHEGFGLPLVEAMELRCPVISSNVASMPEVCGDAALYFDPRCPQQLFEHMKRVLSEQGLRHQLVQKVTERAHHWKWEKAARRMLHALGV
jgi:glycosyltransferase involved in cell wall biosynthesis